MSASQAAEAALGWRATGTREMESTFRAAMRHSRRVRRLRVILPVLAVTGGLVLVLATWFNPLRTLYKLPAELGRLVVSGTKVTMELPRLAGYTRDARPYEFTARAASQDFTKPDTVELKDIRAKVEMRGHGLLEMSANSGIYNSKAEQLTLGHNIRLTSASGYEGLLSEAVLDIRKGHIVSEKPVEMRVLNGVLNANRLEVLNSGELIRFDGGVAMTLTFGKPEDAPAVTKAVE